MLSFSWRLPVEAERSYRVEFLNAHRFVPSAESGMNLFALVLMRSVYCACLCPPAGRANRSLALGVSSAVTHLILEACVVVFPRELVSSSRLLPLPA